MITVAQWLRIWVFSMEVPGLNAGKFLCTLYPTVTVLLEYLDFVIISCLILSCNSITANVIATKCLNYDS